MLALAGSYCDSSVVQCQLWGRPHNWQNGIAERFVLNARNDVLNHVVIFNENNLRRLLKEYIEYYYRDRCHLSLGRDSPLGREVQERSFESNTVKSIPKLVVYSINTSGIKLRKCLLCSSRFCGSRISMDRFAFQPCKSENLLQNFILSLLRTDYLNFLLGIITKMRHFLSR